MSLLHGTSSAGTIASLVPAVVPIKDRLHPIGTSHWEGHPEETLFASMSMTVPTFQISISVGLSLNLSIDMERVVLPAGCMN